MATSFDAAAEAKFRNDVAEYNKTAAPEDRHSQDAIEQEIVNRQMASVVPGPSAIPSNTATELNQKVEQALPETAIVPSPMAAAPAQSASKESSAPVAGFQFSGDEIKKQLLDKGWMIPAAYGSYELAKKALPPVQQLWGSLSQKMTGNSNIPAPQIEPILDAIPKQSNLDAMKERLNMAPRQDVVDAVEAASNLTPDQIRQKKIDIAKDAAQQEMNAAQSATTPPAGQNSPVSPETATPAAPETPTTTAEVVTDPNATPVEKAVTLTQEAPVTEPVAPPKATRAARGSLPIVANNPAPVEGMPGMRENYTKPKGINPATGEPFIGPGGYNWLANQVGPDAAPQMWEEQYGKRNVPHAQVQADYSATRYPPTAVTVEGQSGGAFGTQKYIPEYIKGNASIGGMAAAGLNALGVAGLISDYKEAKKTGDWSNFGLNATGQVLANAIPKAALPAQLATYSKELGESPEELKALGKKLQDAQQASKIGAGRGMQGVPPPNR